MGIMVNYIEQCNFSEMQRNIISDGAVLWGLLHSAAGTGMHSWGKSMNLAGRLKGKSFELFLFGIFIAFLIITRTSYHLLFHTSAEFYVCLVSFGLFFLTLHSVGIKANNFVVFLGIGYFFASVMDLFHVFLYPGVSVIFEGGSQSMVVQFWISARYMTAFTLLGSTIVLMKQLDKIRVNILIIIYLCASVLIVLSILYFRTFPACYAAGSGLTRFKIDSEWIITATLVLVAVLYHRLRRNIDKKLFRYMECHLIFYILSELLFTNFFSPYDWTNVWSHIVRVISHYFLYKAIIETGLKEPYAVLYKEIDKIDNELHLLYETTGTILSSATPRVDIARQCSKIMKFLGCHVYFNYLLEGSGTVMHLNACEGITEQQRRDMEYLPLGKAVCGCAARDGITMVAENIQSTEDARTALVKAFGIRAYACHPLMANGKIIGTLSFGTRSKDSFEEKELMLMKTVAENVSVAIGRKLNEEELIKQAEELRMADHNKNVFLGALSHELRNPLASITAGLSLLEVSQAYEQKEKAKEIMKRQTKQLSSLVDDLLDMTRITCNKIELKKERMELNTIAASVADDHKPMFDKKRILLEKDIETDPIYIDADPVRVKQILSNLVHNSLKFTNPGGRVILSVCTNQAQAMIRVKDNGKGFDPKFLPNLFEPFKQADQSLDRQNGGLGLGLSIVKGIAQLHGGSVQAVSEGIGKGSEFTICLPVCQ